MNFSSIQYQVAGDSNKVTWQFRRGHGKHSNLWNVVGSPENLDLFSVALEYCLGNTNEHPFKTCSIELSDNSGNVWRLDKKDTHSIVSKNGHIQSDASSLSSMYLALKDIEDMDIRIDENQLRTQIAKVAPYGISGTGSHLWAAPWSDNWQKTNAITNFIAENKHKKIQSFVKSLGEKACSSPHIVTKIAPKIEPLYWAYHENQNQIQTYQSVDQYVDTQETSDLALLQKQIEIIDDVRNLHEILSEAGTSIADRKKMIEQNKAEISSILEKLDLETIPSQSKIPDWTKPIEILARIQILERLIRLTAKSKEVIDTQLAPAIELHFDSTRSMIEDQVQSTEELESCLSSINVKIASDTVNNPLSRLSLHGLNAQGSRTPGTNNKPEKSLLAQTEKKKEPKSALIKFQQERVESLIRWVDKLARKMSGTSTESSKKKSIEREPTTNAPQRDDLETMRMSLEYALAKFHELRVNVDLIQDQGVSTLLEIEHIQSRQLKAYNKSRADWKITSENLNLPQSLNLSQLIQIVTSHMKLFELSEKQEIYRGYIDDRKSNLHLLESKILQWRRLNRSQKQTGLGNSAILLNEARSILLYENDRKNKLKSMNEDKHKQNESKISIKILYERNIEIELQWKSLFSEHNLQLISISSSKSAQIFKFAAAMETLNSLICDSPGKDLEAAFLCSGDDLNIWRWQTQDISHESRLGFLKCIETHDFSQPNFFLSGDDTLSDFLQKMGVGNITFTENKSSHARSRTETIGLHDPARRHPLSQANISPHLEFTANEGQTSSRLGLDNRQQSAPILQRQTKVSRRELQPDVVRMKNENVERYTNRGSEIANHQPDSYAVESHNRAAHPMKNRQGYVASERTANSHPFDAQPSTPSAPSAPSAISHISGGRPTLPMKTSSSIRKGSNVINPTNEQRTQTDTQLNAKARAVLDILNGKNMTKRF